MGNNDHSSSPGKMWRQELEMENSGICVKASEMLPRGDLTENLSKLDVKS